MKTEKRNLQSKLKVHLLVTSVTMFFLMIIFIFGVSLYLKVPTERNQYDLLIIEKNYEKLSADELQGSFSAQLSSKLKDGLRHSNDENIVFVESNGNIWGSIADGKNNYGIDFLDFSTAELTKYCEMIASGQLSFSRVEYLYDFIPYRCVTGAVLQKGGITRTVVIAKVFVGLHHYGEVWAVALFIVFLLAALTAIVVNNTLTRRLRRNIRELVESVNMLSKSNYQQPLTAKLDDEMQEVLDEIESMRQKIVKQVENLELYAQEQAEFAGNVAHELRTPMSVVTAWLEMLEETPNISEEKKSSYIKKMQSGMEQLSRVVNNLLLVARMSEGDLSEINKVKINVKEKMTELVQTSMQKWTAKKQQVDWLIADDITLFSDENMFDIIISNLLDNAFKYSPEKSVITLSAEHEGSSKMVVSISNGGDVLEEKQVQSMFKRFYRVNKKNVGWGIGLHLVKKIAGIIGVELKAEALAAGGIKISVYFDADYLD